MEGIGRPGSPGEDVSLARWRDFWVAYPTEPGPGFRLSLERLTGETAKDWREASRTEARLREITVEEVVRGCIDADRERARRVRGMISRAAVKTARIRREERAKRLEIVFGFVYGFGSVGALLGGLWLYGGGQITSALVLWCAAAVVSAFYLRYERSERS